MSDKGKRPPIVQAELYLKSKEYITPHYIRITLTGADVPLFAGTTIGVNNKIFIPPAGVNKVFFPDYNFESNEWTFPPEEVRPSVRTYTHRGFDLDKKEMIIDFVSHGDSGPASAWAISAKEGDPLGVAMKAAPTELYPQADWYLLVADATGIPVIAAILERLPENAKGIAHIEVQSPQDEQLLKAPSGIKINWLHNAHPGAQDLLSAVVRSTDLPDKASGSRFGYVAAEFSSVKDIRQFLRKEQNWSTEELYAYSYWKFGVSEEGSVKDRHQEQQEAKHLA
ncbi:siderophore-interacting protein [Pedobacter nutrimenti]|jgi:NADPH-dependent ferric siderophore reductase|uniref:NADPH-dependent ferric siderophore reductase n=1 Tax=Pedobacter nutrimenti TaxID=1241337 RepID=A0A318UNK0_9SPHI|nr:siderophore-interacting protein [Pedobacter nutrimenti]PYF71581.1 NADPH-dependent ferric siderophore reductase [Pedobacter nutrimenti]